MTSTLVQTHLAHLTFAGASPRTIEARAGILTRLTRDAGPLPTLTEADLLTWLTRPLAPESRRAYRGHIVGFYAWCVDHGHLDRSPAERLPTVKVPQRQPRPISREDFRVALDAAPVRMRAWLLLMALEGLRCIEVAALEPRDLWIPDTGLPLLRLRVTKGGGQASVPLHPDVLDALAVLPVRRGVWWSVNARTVSFAVGQHLRSVGVRASSHQLRHLAATEWYRSSGNDLLTTALLMRHVRVSSTQGYAALDPVRPSEVVNLVRLTA